MKYAVLIPAYNASPTLKALLDRTTVMLPPVDIVVIDDGSNDRTGEIARQAGVVTLTHPANRGKGAALSTGFAWALEHDYEAVITMDSDLQHRPEDILRFIQAYDETHADIIIGSRLRAMQGMPYHRRLSNVMTTGLVRARTGAPIEDSQSGFRFIHSRALRLVQTASDGFEAETEFIIRAALKQCTFGTIQIETIYAGEKSTMRHWHTIRQFIKVLLTDY